MTMIDHRCNQTVCKRAVAPALSLLLIGVLSACSDTGVSGVSTNASEQTLITPTVVRPSSSAAELANDSTVTVQAALARVTESDTEVTQTVAPPSAANPDTVNPLAPIEESSVPDTEETASPSTPVTQSVDENTEDKQEVSVPTLPIVDNSIGQTSFTSVTNPGFTGEVLDDAIRINWQADPNARGYNVYKQAEYYTTVFGTEFVDTDVYDDDYYYEIQAFDYDDTLYYIATGLTVSARTFGKTDPDAAQANAELLQDYELVFGDEFTNLSLDTIKWNTSFLWGTDLVINSEEQYYVDVANDPDFGFNPFSFDGEYLTISTIETPDELSTKAQNQPYLSGIITSYDAFKFTYGYIETRAKFTHGRGYWPAFWLLNAYYVDASPEIDIMEFIGHNQDVVYHTYHYFDSEGNLRSTKSFPVPGTDYTADFHTYGVEWMPGTLIFYIDGIETYRIVDANVSQQEMYVIANQAVGGWWAGSPDATTPLPGEFLLDYIRVYQRTTPYEDFQFDQSTDLIPLFSDSPGEVIPNKRPPFWLWPEGYPQGQ